MSRCQEVLDSVPGGPEPTQFPSMVDVQERLSRSQIIDIMETGQGGKMPSFPYLSDEEKEAIIDYLFQINEERPSEFHDQEFAENDSTFTYTVDFAYRSFLDEEGYPATKPPWGTLNAMNLNTGELVWKVPLGEYSELTERGIPVTGTPNMGGSIVTAGGLVFIGATADEKFRAFDKQNGGDSLGISTAGGWVCRAIHLSN